MVKAQHPAAPAGEIRMEARPCRVIVVLGRPCAGKSTLARSLAECLRGGFLSVGELIRKGREDPDARARSDEAFLAREMFDAQWLASLLDAHFSQLTDAPELIVMDAGPPVDEVLTLLRWPCDMVVHLTLDEAEALLRRQRRTGAREDDEVDLFRARSRWAVDHLPGILDRLGTVSPIVDIDASWPVEVVLREALSAWLRVEAVSTHEPQLVDPFASGSLKDRLDAAPITPSVAITPLGATRMQAVNRPNSMLLLLKPGVGFPPDIIEQIEERAGRFGYFVRQVGRIGSSGGLAGKAAAHYDIAYLFANWPAAVIGSLGPGLSRQLAKPISHTDLVRFCGREAALSHWNEDGPVPPTRIAAGAWGVGVTLPGGTDAVLVNAHIGRLMELFTAPDSAAYAVLLSQYRKGGSWQAMREDFLGKTNPQFAPAGSLRGDAYSGALRLSDRASFRNNAFHLSAGPIEAVRETAIWLGEGTANQIAAEMGLLSAWACRERPVAISGSCIEWSNESAEARDADDPAFVRLCGQLRIAAE